MANHRRYVETRPMSQDPFEVTDILYNIETVDTINKIEMNILQDLYRVTSELMIL